MTSFFPGSFFADSPAVTSNNTSFHPLFRLLDDFEQHSRSNNTDSEQHRSGRHKIMKTFAPKFDVKELPDAYELHGDLPGIEQKDVEIEFTDIQTITIRGRTERSYTAGTPPAIEDGSAAAPQGQIEGSNSDAAAKNAGHKATVEDEDGTVAASNSKSTEVATTTKKQEQKQPEAKYWVSERAVGEFSRSFTFPVRVDQDAVTASMKNGVITIAVPKAKKQGARKIPIT